MLAGFIFSGMQDSWIAGAGCLRASRAIRVRFAVRV